jgi:hypothetical protein
VVLDEFMDEFEIWRRFEIPRRKSRWTALLDWDLGVTMNDSDHRNGWMMGD